MTEPNWKAMWAELISEIGRNVGNEKTYHVNEIWNSLGVIERKHRPTLEALVREYLKLSTIDTSYPNNYYEVRKQIEEMVRE